MAAPARTLETGPIVARPALVLTVLVAAFWTFRIVWPTGSLGADSFDLRSYFYPTYDAFYGRLARGELLTWNPFQLCGEAWLGSPAAGYFYPPHVIFLLLPTHVAMAASSLLHLAFSALAMLVLARRLGLGANAGILAAVLFTLRGTMAVWVRWPYHLEAGVWLPVGAIAILALAGGRLASGVALLATSVGMSWLAGGPQVTVFSLYAWSALFLVLLVGAERRATLIAAFALALALGGAAGAIQLEPSRELARVAARAGQQLETARMFPFGDPGLRLLEGMIGGSQSAFALAALALVPAVIFARARAVVVWAAAVGGLALVLALGTATPFFRLYLALPLLGWFRGPYRLLYLVDFCGALLAGIAFDVLLASRSDARPSAPRRLAIVCAAALAVYAASRGHYLPAVGGGLCAALLATPWAGTPMAASVLLLAALLEVFAAPARQSPLPYGAAAAAGYRLHEAAYGTLAELQQTSRVWIVRPPLFPSNLAPRRATSYGVRVVDDYEPVTLGRHAEYFTYLAEGRTRPANTTATFLGWFPPPRPGTPWGLVSRRRLLDLAAVAVVAIPPNMLALEPVRALVADAGLEPLPSSDPRLAFWRNPHAAPRAYVAYRTEAAPEPDVLLGRLADPSFDPLALAYVEGAGGPPPTDSAPRGHAATITRDDPTVVEVDATLSAPGLVVLADAFYPAWRATVDGTPAPILATDHLFRGVPTPAGRHHIRFAYSTSSLKLAAAVSLAAWLTIAWLALRGRSR